MVDTLLRECVPPSPGLLRKLLRYEPDTGKLFWRERTPDMFEGGLYSSERSCRAFNTRHADKEAFTSDSFDGYKQGMTLGKAYQAHRIVWALHYGEWPEGQIDHINGIRDDNRIVNLRVVSNSENCKNQKLRSTNTSGHLGVSWHKPTGRWQAYIQTSGRINYLGIFKDFEEAVKVRKEAEEKYGYHENHGRN